VSPVKYELGFYIPEDDILHSPCCEHLKSYIVTGFICFTIRENHLKALLPQLLISA
jgi:hypothetical protein